MPDELEAIAAEAAETASGPPEGRAVEEAIFLEVLDEAVSILDADDIPYVLMGGVASTTVGRSRLTQDIDLFVRPEDARLVLAKLGASGFETEERFPHWLYKAHKHGLLIDIIFRSAGDIYLDEEMLERARHHEYKGRRLRLIPPEDLVVIKAIVHEEHMPRHWHDALSVIGTTELDWDYLVRRARRGPRRVLSLLLYAQSNDLLVPARAVRELFELISDD